MSRTQGPDGRWQQDPDLAERARRFRAQMLTEALDLALGREQPRPVTDQEAAILRSILHAVALGLEVVEIPLKTLLDRAKASDHNA